MRKIQNLVAPFLSSFLGEGKAVEGFIGRMGGFYISFSYDFCDAENLMFSSKAWHFFGFKDGPITSYAYKENGKYFLLERGRKKKLSDASVIEKIETVERGDYRCVKTGLWSYKIENTKTGKAISIDKRQHRFLTGYGELLYFFNAGIPSEIVAVNEDSQLVKSHSIEGSGYVSVEVVDNYVFATSSRDYEYLEIFDLDAFRAVVKEIRIKGVHPEVLKINGVYHILVGGELFLWDGSDLDRQLFEKDISGILVKEGFIYIGFIDDPNVYAYRPSTFDLLAMKRVTLNGYFPWSFSKNGQYNVASVQRETMRTEPHQQYIAAWNDFDFFNDESWEVVVESTICSESKEYTAKSFAIRVEVNSSVEFVKLIRHSMACVDEIISHHAIMVTATSAVQSYSADFNGQVKLVFKRAKSLKDNHRKQLIEGIEKIQSDYEVAFKAFSGGDMQPVEIDVEFID